MLKQRNFLTEIVLNFLCARAGRSFGFAVIRFALAYRTYVRPEIRFANNKYSLQYALSKILLAVFLFNGVKV